MSPGSLKRTPPLVLGGAVKIGGSKIYFCLFKSREKKIKILLAFSRL
jgi:hypothetical protein